MRAIYNFSFVTALLMVCFMIASTISGSNPDSTASLLMGNDIVNGNIFLSGWRIPSDHFLLTDIILYIPFLALFGVTDWILPLGSSILAVTTLLLSWKLVSLKTKPKNQVIAKLVTAGLIFPSTFLLYDTFRVPAHGGTTVLALLATLLTMQYHSHSGTRKKKVLFWMFVVSSAACFSDLLYVFIATLPICCVAGYEYLTKEKDAHSNLVLISVQAGALLFAQVLTALFTSFGMTVVQHHFEFAQLIELSRNFQIFFEGYMKAYGANFFGSTLQLSVGIAILSVVKAVLPVIAVRNIGEITRRRGDVLPSLLLLPAIIVFSSFILSTFPLDSLSVRYLLPGMVFLAPLVGIWVAEITIPKRVEYLGIAAMSLSLLVVLHGGLRAPDTTQKTVQLVQKLQELGLTRGYGTYYSGTPVAVYSKGQIFVSPVRGLESVVQPYYWLSPSAWYDTPANFLITTQGDGERLLFLVEKSVGRASKEVKVGEYVVHLWNRDISSALERDPNKEL